MVDVPTPPRQQVTYFAISLFSSRTFWFNTANFVVAALSLKEVTTIIPPRFMPMQAMIVALINLYLRMITVRPVAIIAPGNTAPTVVDRIGPPPPANVTD